LCGRRGAGPSGTTLARRIRGTSHLRRQRTYGLSGQSPQGYEDAIREAVERASSTIRNIQSVWAKEFEAVVENNRVTQFRVVVKIGFLLDEGGSVG
jgi:dodecin